MSEKERQQPTDSPGNEDGGQASSPQYEYFGQVDNIADRMSQEETSNVDEVVENLIMAISKEPLFHGTVGADDVKEMLKSNGDYVLRIPEAGHQKTADGTTPQAIVTVRWGEKIRDFALVFLKHGTDGKERLVTINGRFVKGSILELLREHQATKIPLENDVLLIRPVPRQAWELPKEKVVLEKQIGEGSFGAVWQGTLRPDNPSHPVKNVAIKLTKISDENKLKMEEIMMEARFMRQLQHPNVVAFHGVVSDGSQVMIVMELIKGGSLDNHLRKTNNIPVADKCSYAFDIAYGLFYLHSKRTIHRDMAARNCLIDIATNIVKISDFGMSKQGETYKINAKERTPIRWQAPEVMRTSLYTKECDVYSYGMVLFEIFTNGKVPFEGVANAVIRTKIREATFRPTVPSSAPGDVQEIIRGTWDAVPAKRPTMRTIFYKLRKYCKHPIIGSGETSGSTRGAPAKKTNKTPENSKDGKDGKKDSMRIKKTPKTKPKGPRSSNSTRGAKKKVPVVKKK